MLSAVAPIPRFNAQLATLADAAPSGEQWLHELVYEGYRVGCQIEHGRVQLLGQDDRQWTASFPEIAAAAQDLPLKSALLDGAVTLVLPDGTTSFPKLQAALSGAPREGLTYFVFDLLYLNGRDLTDIPLERRKAQCKRLLQRLPPQAKLRYSQHFEIDGPTLLAKACELGAAGIISKRRDRAYQPGKSEDWLTIKCPKQATNSRGVVITTPERPVYPGLDFDKLDLAKLYAELAERMLPYIANRPLTLVRCEGGVRKPDALRSECKFLRHEPGWHRWAHEPIRRVQIQEQKKVGEYLVVDSPEGLVSLIQGDITEIHVWNATTFDLERPDRIIFDLDPGAEVPWSGVLETAQMLRAELADRDLECWPKLTGGKGLHVVLPFAPEHGWAEVYAFSRTIAEAVARRDPASLTLDFTKAGRTTKILIDYKRNHRAAVAVAAYSTRANPRGTLSVPVGWSELNAKLLPEHFTVNNILDRVQQHQLDPWRDFWTTQQRLFQAAARRPTPR
jgi:DNA ligase D-like protein (predicted polymerase)